MNSRTFLMTAVVAGGLYIQTAGAANIAVTNSAMVSAPESGQVCLQFDVSWDASWRASWTESGTWTNWDAAWIFVKYRCRDGANTNWNHASLSTNDLDHMVPAGSTINVGLSANAGGTNFGAGVFLYRSSEGSGSWTNRGVKLRWWSGADGVAVTSRMDICVHAIEMVYVPQGSFYLGDGATTVIRGRFENGKFTNAFLVTNENYAITLGGGTDGSLGNNNAEDMAGAPDDFNDTTTKILPAAFPKGYSAFYCMKYETSQGQYADFLNQLASYTQGTNHCPNNSDHRYTISGSWPNYSASAPTRACTYLYWTDDAAYADWAGLRPMTELEYEKACRGPLSPVVHEYAWGTAAIVADSGDGTINVSSPENGTETNTTDVSLGAAVYGHNQIKVGGVNSGDGPVRCGLFATTNSGRVSSGSTYWGIMEMSGNVWERPVSVGKPEGRAFRGTCGDGVLSTNGYANNLDWPGYSAGEVIGATGAGLRGGNWNDLAISADVSQRFYMSTTFPASGNTMNHGWRGVRGAP